MDLLKIVYTGLLRQTRYSLRVIETELANQLIRFSQFNHLREGDLDPPFPDSFCILS